MIKTLALGLAAAVLVPAAAGAATYSAKPVLPVAAKRIVVRDIIWTCGPAACSGTTAESRPVILCQGLAKRAGAIESFSVNGRALPVADLSVCNKFARGGPTPVLARN